MQPRLRTRRLIKQRQRARKIEIRIRRYQLRDPQPFGRLSHQHRPRPSVLQLMCIFRIREKGKLLAPGVLHPRYADNFYFRIAAQLTPQLRRKFTQLHFSRVRGFRSDSPQETLSIPANLSCISLPGGANMADFEALKQKYKSVLDLIPKRGVRLDHLHVQDDKLFMQGGAPNQDIKNEIWNAIKAVDPTYSDLTCDLRIDSSLSAPAPEPTIYTVVAGDSLWAISEKFLGGGANFHQLIAANPDKLKDEKSVIHPGDTGPSPLRALPRGPRITTTVSDLTCGTGFSL